MGDAVDNVPGVPGVGRKTALAIVAAYGGVEAVIERAERFVEVWRDRDRLVEAIDAAGREAELTSDAAAAVGGAAADLADDLDRLRQAERDEDFRGRLDDVAKLLREADPGGIVAKTGRPGRPAVRPLAPLKRELKALDRGSGKRVWFAIGEHVEQLRLSKQLVTLHLDVPVDVRAEGLELAGVDTERARRLFRSLGFTSIVDDLEGEAGGDEPAEAAANRYRVILTRPELQDLAGDCRRAGRTAIALRTSEDDPLRCSLIGIALGRGDGEAAYLPLGHDYLGAPAQLALDAVRDELGSLLADADVPKVGHDLKRIVHVLRRHGLRVEGWALDTAVAAFLLDSSRSKVALETLAGELLGRDVVAGDPAADGPEAAPVEPAAEQTAGEADLTWCLAGRLRERLEGAGLDGLYDTIDGPLLPVLAEMEARGVRIDTGRLERMSLEMATELERTRREIHELAGVEFNVDSPKQLREVLFERLGLEPRKRTAKSKAPSTDAQTLEELAPEHAIAGKLLAYRELAKLKGTYVDALPRLVHPETGRIHTSFHPTGAATGRLSSSDPNLQNIPARTEAGRKIREAFVPDEGHRFLASDYSQVELRVLAHLTGDPELTAAFRAGEDIHRHTAARVFDVHPDLVTDAMRRRAKAVNFGILYGMSETRLAREQGIPRAEARRFIHAYFDRFDRVRDYIDAVREQAQEEAAVRTLFGRVRLFPQLRQQVNRAVREQALRAAVNTTVQGTAADLMKLAMLAVARELGRARLGARILLQVHDELLLEVPAGEVEPTAALVRRAMEEVHRLDVPLTVDQKTGRNWLEAT
jgi:DNA polymerase-1